MSEFYRGSAMENESVKVSASEKEFLKKYNADKYPRPSVTTDNVTFSIDENGALSVLLVKRARPPFAGCFAIPGGFLEPNETVETCAVREITEETNVTPRAIFPVGIFSTPGRDPRGWVISCAFFSAVARSEVRAVGMDDAAQALWFTVSVSECERGKTEMLTLKNGETTVTAQLERTDAPIGRSDFRILSAEELAFDHAAILAAALDGAKKHCEDESFLRLFLPKNADDSELSAVRGAIRSLWTSTENA